MKKPPSYKHQLVRSLKECIRAARKLTKQVDRKLATLSSINKAKAEVQKLLVEHMGKAQ